MGRRGSKVEPEQIECTVTCEYDGSTITCQNTKPGHEAHRTFVPVATGNPDGCTVQWTDHIS